MGIGEAGNRSACDKTIFAQPVLKGGGKQHDVFGDNYPVRSATTILTG
jgi:hypothetical protein